jgi:parallel beta-helix repeat protein
MFKIVILIFDSKDCGCMKRLFVVFAIMLFVAGLLVVFVINGEESLAQPTTIIVDLGGVGDYESIQAAIDNASSGDTIIVQPGIYYENITLNKTLNLTGSGAEDTIIYGEQVATVLFINANWSNVTGFTITGYWSYSNILITGNNNLIRDCSLVGNVIGIGLKNSEYNVIKNCTCYANSGAGIYFGNSGHNEILDTNCFNSTYGPGFYFFYGYRNTIINCTSTGNSDEGLYAYWLSYNNVVLNCTFNYNSGSGVHIFDSDNFRIENCTSIGNGKNGIIVSSNGNTIRNCIVNSNSADGFYMYHSEYSEITNNQCFLNGGRGFYIKYSERNIIRNNALISNGDYGIYIGPNCNNNTIYQNDFINNYNDTKQVVDRGENNVWDVAGTGNYWWDYLFHYHNTTHDGRVWERPYDIMVSKGIRDLYPLVVPRIAQNEIEAIHPGIMDDSDSDGVYDLIDAYPMNSSKWIAEPKEEYYPLLIGPFVDREGDPIPSVNVSMDIDGILYSNVTNELGLVTLYLVDMPKDDQYTLIVNKEGYKEMRFDVTLLDGGMTNPGPHELRKADDNADDGGFVPGFELGIILVALGLSIFLIEWKRKKF